MARERTSLRRRLLVAAIVVTGLVLAVLYLLGQCHRFGKSPGGKASGTMRAMKAGSPEPAGGAARCQLRLDRTGLRLGGKPATVPAAVKRCRKLGAAELTITGDARHGDAEELQRALRAAGVTVVRKR